MIRSKLLLNRLRDKKIFYISNCGQNWQLLLPVAWDNKCGFIDKCLYTYYVRPDSHYHSADYSEHIKRQYIYEQIVINTMYFISDEDKAKLFPEVHKKFSCDRLHFSAELMYKYYIEAMKAGGSLLKFPFKIFIRLLKLKIKFMLNYKI